MHGTNRRQFLRVGTAVGVAGLAGCAGILDGGGRASEWEGTFGNDDFRTHLWGVTPTSDGGYIVAGSQRTTEASFDALLLKVDGEGEEEWLETFSGPGWDWLNRAVETDDGYVAAGTKTTEANPDGEAWLLSVEEDGDENWQKTYHEAGITWNWSFAATDDGGYVLVGRTTEERADWQPMVVKADAEGDEDWRDTFLPDDATGGRFNGVGRTDDGFLLTGNLTESGHDQPRSHAVAIDVGGDEQWSETYDDGRLGRLVPVDGGYLVSGVAHGSAGREGWLLNVGTDGTERWSETYDDLMGIADVVPASGLLGAGGSYLSVGWSMEDGEENNRTGWMLSVDGEGTKRAESTWDDAESSNVTAVEHVAKGTYAVAGHADEDGVGADDNFGMGRLIVTSSIDPDS